MQPTRFTSPWEEKREELCSAAQLAAKRVHAVVTIAQSREAPQVFVRAAQRAKELLEDAAESLYKPEYQIRGLTPAGDGAKSVAFAMCSVNEPHATTITPPMSLMREQAAMSVLTGSTRAVPVAELLGFLAMLKKTGILWVTGGDETFTLQLEEGFLVHASSTTSPANARLGDLLVALGHVTRERLDAFLADFSRARGKLGIALESAGFVTSSQLAEALEQQVRLLFQRLFAAGAASFSFSERKSNSSENRLRLGITHLLLESARRPEDGRPPAPQLP